LKTFHSFLGHAYITPTLLSTIRIGCVYLFTFFYSFFGLAKRSGAAAGANFHQLLADFPLLGVQINLKY